MRLASARFEREILLNRPRNLARPLQLIRRNANSILNTNCFDIFSVYSTEGTEEINNSR
jgi:hypothetical protein